MDELSQKVAANIRAARMRVGLSQAEAARRTGVSVQHFNNWERARARPSLRRITTVAQVCNVTVDYLLTGDATS